jgi:hypothetical protein
MHRANIFLNHAYKGTEEEEFVPQMAACPGEIWVGNGVCDDEVNIPECNYDGQDCCQQPVSEGFCTLCTCLTP